MTYCFLSAMDAETQYLRDVSTLEGVEELGSVARLYRLNYQGVAFYVCVSGIGKVLSSSAAAVICATHKDIDAIINVGIGGSMDAAKAPVLSAVLGQDFVQHDMDTTAFGDPRGYLYGVDRVRIEGDKGLNGILAKALEKKGVPYCYGTMASGDHFIAEEKDKAVIAERFGALLLDMEAAAIAEACYVYHKPFACLRIVSDAVDHHAEYVKYKPIAGRLGAEVALSLLTSGE